ncbi:small acid-soluble spore protein Tlp [Oceanobacillus sp. CFH 90083]|uniref:small acid-soluble spore protein Tlp n=1 Tax=Oceanobacillus sp. CFH 90083 TaxID=2592336 RepID=UPI00128B7A6A|nr:small acid-soluble spore protein Tlp [Oceanobacillus sp. CFH 90083]
MTRPKPDDRSNNTERIENTIAHTLQNMNEAEDFVKAHAEEMNAHDKKDIESKNERRRESIEGLRAELKDEANHE